HQPVRVAGGEKEQGQQNPRGPEYDLHLINVPFRSSAYARRISSSVFITIGPYHATGSSIGLPDTRRNRMPSSPAWTVTSSPRSKSTSEWLLTSYTGCASGFATCSVRTARGSDESRNVPERANT